MSAAANLLLLLLLLGERFAEVVLVAAGPARRVVRWRRRVLEKKAERIG